MSSLRLKFGGLIAVVACWSLLLLYLITSLELVPAPFAILQNGLDNRDLITEAEIMVSEVPEINNLQSASTTFLPDATQKATNITTIITTTVHSHQDTVRIVIASDGLGLGGLISTIHSVLLHTKHSVKFYIITTDKELPHLRLWIESTKLHKMSYELHRLTALTNDVTGGLRHVKVRATQLFPELWGRVIYLDCDVIVQGDIWELYNAPIRSGDYGVFSHDCNGGSPAGGWSRVPMMGIGRKPRYATYINLHHSQLIKENSTLHIDPNTCPFATGVFVANLTLWRQQSITDQILHWLKLHKKETIVGNHPGVSALEAAMLIVLYGKVSPMDPLWHVQHLGAVSGSRYSKQFVERAKLLHWSGQFKPWTHRAAHREIWDRYFIPDPSGQFRPIRKRETTSSILKSCQEKFFHLLSETQSTTRMLELTVTQGLKMRTLSSRKMSPFRNKFSSSPLEKCKST